VFLFHIIYLNINLHPNQQIKYYAVKFRLGKGGTVTQFCNSVTTFTYCWGDYYSIEDAASQRGMTAKKGHLAYLI